MSTFKYKTQLLVQTAEGAWAPCILCVQVGKLKVLNLRVQKTRGCSEFDQRRNIRRPSSVFHNLKLDSIFFVTGGNSLPHFSWFWFVRNFVFHILPVCISSIQDDCLLEYVIQLALRSWNMCGCKCSAKYTWYGAKQPRPRYILLPGELSFVLRGCTSKFWTGSINSHHTDQMQWASRELCSESSVSSTAMVSLILQGRSLVLRGLQVSAQQLHCQLWSPSL